MLDTVVTFNDPGFKTPLIYSKTNNRITIKTRTLISPQYSEGRDGISSEFPENDLWASSNLWRDEVMNILKSEFKSIITNSSEAIKYNFSVCKFYRWFNLDHDMIIVMKFVIDSF